MQTFGTFLQLINLLDNGNYVLRLFCILFFICLVFQTILFFSLFTYVFFDRENLTIIAYNSEKGKKKVYSIEDLWRVREGLIYTVLVFKGKRKIRYLAKASSIFEEDGESYISSLKKRAKKNRQAAI